jgi:hypothetical protein
MSLNLELKIDFVLSKIIAEIKKYSSHPQFVKKTKIETTPSIGFVPSKIIAEIKVIPVREHFA